MVPTVNQHLVTQTNLDSGSLTMLGMVVHQFPDPGYYMGTVWEGTQSVARFHIQVDPEFLQPQTNIDLASLAAVASGAVGASCPGCAEGSSEAEFKVNPKGYVLFYVSQGPGGFAVTISKGATASGGNIFDSRQLREGDLFVSSVLRPGQYTVTNKVNNQNIPLKVNYAPPVQAGPYAPPKPVEIIAHGQGFNLQSLEIQSLQGKVFRIQTPTRISIDLVTPQDQRPN